MMCSVPETQWAIELTGPGQLRLNRAKSVPVPAARQILCRVEAVGLCFSDLKLLQSHARHTRKSEVVSGIASDVLQEVPSYVPGDLPTVPGHEAAVRVSAMGEGVTCVSPGGRYLVQTDYRWLHTAESNAAFGYNFEGALQQYVLMDERVIVSPEGECMLLPAPEGIAASSIALVEPWACVEQAYANEERRWLTPGGRMLVVADAAPPASALTAFLHRERRPGELLWLGADGPPTIVGVAVRRLEGSSQIPDASCDDVLYLGARAETVDAVMPKIAAGGLLNIVRCGGRFSRDVALPVGRVHYSGVRIAGTPGADPGASFACIPESLEVREGDRLDIVGAGGPMGVMHVLRDLCLGVPDVELWAGDLNDDRLRELQRTVAALSDLGETEFHAYNPTREGPSGDPDYVVVMVPSPGLVADAVARARLRGRISIFAGMPVEEMVPVDLNAYIDKEIYVTGTSGSRVEDMKTVLYRISVGSLNTNLSVAAVCGLEGVIEGLRAVADRSVAGKVIVYPSCERLALTRLTDLPTTLPDVGASLEGDMWSRQAESALLRYYAS